MNDEYFYADVDLPFHVWVREKGGADGPRWVLREAPHAPEAPPPTGPGCGPGARAAGG